MTPPINMTQLETHDVQSPAGDHLTVVLLMVLVAVLAAGGVVAYQWKQRQPTSPSLNTAVVHYPEDVEKHLATGADVNEVNSGGGTPLLTAVAFKKNDAARKLIEAGADPNIAGKDGRTPLVWASRFSVDTAGVHPEQIEIALLLLEAGADPNVVDPGLGYTPLHYAVRTDDTNFLSKLIEAGADLNAGTTQDWSPLRMAVHERSPNMAAALIDAGADVDVPDHNGSTPLLRACMTGQPEIVELLLKGGASPDAENAFGSKPTDWASNPKLRELFEQYAQLSTTDK